MKFAKSKFLIRPGYIISISAVIAFIMVVSAFFELSRSKEEIYHLLEEQANSLVYTIDMSSANTVISDQEIENLVTLHLLGTAKNVARLDSISQLSNTLLKKIADENEVFRINVFDANAVKIFSNFTGDSTHLKERNKYSPKEYIEPILKGEKDEVIIGLKEARFEEGNRYAVAVRRPYNRNGAIVTNLDAESFLEFKKKTGFGKMIQDVGNYGGIVYIVFQDEKNIIAANRKADDLSNINGDVFLQKALTTNESMTRIISFEGKQVYEAVKAFVVDGQKQGIIRIALNMDEIFSVEDRMMRRMIIMSLILIAIAVSSIGLITSGQNYKILSGKYEKIRSFTGDILENMSQGVITAGKNGTVTIFNKSAAEIFGITREEAEGKKLSEINSLNGTVVAVIFEKKEILTDNIIDLFIREKGKKILSVNTSISYDKENVFESFTAVIKDITEISTLEKQVQQREKLHAMGELASGVAHEVRNPLNTINMIAQRFGKEYAQKINSEEFGKLTEILKTESERVNNIVRQFLSFARPPKLNLNEISSKDFLEEIRNIAEVIVKPHGIIFSLIYVTDKMLMIDKELMKQVFLNIIKNSADATDNGGMISLEYIFEKGKNTFILTDSGTGIPEDIKDKIFNLYFTTKTTGTGLGLSIVQQIVSQHNGNIKVESAEGKGTRFVIEI